MCLLSKFIRRVRTKAIGSYISDSVLDLGCGDAVTLKLFSDKIENYWGVEYGPDQVEQLKQRFPQHEFVSKNLDEETLSFPIRFDAVLLIAVIEHLFNQKHLFQQILKNLKPDGKIIITTPTPLGDMVHRFGSKIGLFAQSADDHHIIIYNRRRFKVLADFFDLKLIKYKLFGLRCNQLVVLTRKK